MGPIWSLDVDSRPASPLSLPLSSEMSSEVDPFRQLPILHGMHWQDAEQSESQARGITLLSELGTAFKLRDCCWTQTQYRARRPRTTTKQFTSGPGQWTFLHSCSRRNVRNVSEQQQSGELRLALFISRTTLSHWSRASGNVLKSGSKSKPVRGEGAEHFARNTPATAFAQRGERPLSLWGVLLVALRNSNKTACSSLMQNLHFFSMSLIHESFNKYVGLADENGERTRWNPLSLAMLPDCSRVRGEMPGSGMSSARAWPVARLFWLEVAIFR